MAGRNTILTSELQKRICENLMLGLSQQDAVTLAGVSESAFYEWLQRGRNEAERLRRSARAKPRAREAVFVEFAEAVKKAVAQSKRVLLGRIVDAGKTTWQADAWLLERRYPREFGQRVIVAQEVQRELEAALDVIGNVISSADYAAVLAALSAADRTAEADGAE